VKSKRVGLLGLLFLVLVLVAFWRLGEPSISLVNPGELVSVDRAKQPRPSRLRQEPADSDAECVEHVHRDGDHNQVVVDPAISPSHFRAVDWFNPDQAVPNVEFRVLSLRSRSHNAETSTIVRSDSDGRFSAVATEPFRIEPVVDGRLLVSKVEGGIVWCCQQVVAVDGVVEFARPGSGDMKNVKLSYEPSTKSQSADALSRDPGSAFWIRENNLRFNPPKLESNGSFRCFVPKVENVTFVAEHPNHRLAIVEIDTSVTTHVRLVLEEVPPEVVRPIDENGLALVGSSVVLYVAREDDLDVNSRLAISRTSRIGGGSNYYIVDSGIVPKSGEVSLSPKVSGGERFVLVHAKGFPSQVFRGDQPTVLKRADSSPARYQLVCPSHPSANLAGARLKLTLMVNTGRGGKAQIAAALQGEQLLDENGALDGAIVLKGAVYGFIMTLSDGSSMAGGVVFRDSDQAEIHPAGWSKARAVVAEGIKNK